MRSILTWKTISDSGHFRLEIKDGGWGDSHALIPTGQRDGDVCLAIDSTDNVEFEFED